MSGIGSGVCSPTVRPAHSVVASPCLRQCKPPPHQRKSRLAVGWVFQFKPKSWMYVASLWDSTPHLPYISVMSVVVFVRVEVFLSRARMRSLMGFMASSTLPRLFLRRAMTP